MAWYFNFLNNTKMIHKSPILTCGYCWFSQIPIRKKQGGGGGWPTSLPMGCTWATEWASRGLPMGILPCKLGCPLLPYMETVGSLVGSPLRPNIKKWAAEWAAHGNFAMQIRLPTTSIYGNSGQLSGQPTTSKYEKVGSSVGSGVGCPWEFCHANKSAHYFHIRI